MSSRSNRIAFLAVVLALSLIAFVGCGQGHEGDHSHPDGETHADDHAAEVGEVVEAGGGEALEVMLAKADALDGTEDKVVAKCAGCALQMDGSADHTLEAAGYELHFCSEGCRGNFAEGTEEALMALQIPE